MTIPPASELSAPPAVPLTGVAATFRSLRHRNYRLYFIGQLISLTGSWMQTAALMWVAYQATHLKSWPAALSAAQLLPTCILGGWSGGLADRWPKRDLLLVTQVVLLVQALGLAALVWVDLVNPWYLLALAIVSGLAQAVDLPARLAFVVELVGREDVINAVALNSLMFNGARILGPLLAGTLYEWLGAGPCFLANALSYVAVIWALWLMVIIEPVRPARSRKETNTVLAGFRYLAVRTDLGLLAVLFLVVAICGWPFMSLLPALSSEVLHADQRGYTLLLSATGTGAGLAALTVATFGSNARSQLFIGTGVGIIVAGLLGMSAAETLPVALVCSLLAGFGLILFNATSQSVVQLSANERNRGQIMGIWAMILSGGMPLGNFLSGPAADAWGVPWVLRAQGIVCGVIALGLLGVQWRRNR